EDRGVGAQLAAGHGVEEAGEGDVVEHLTELGGDVGAHGVAAAGGGDVPGLAAAPLEDGRADVGETDVGADDEHAVVGQQADVGRAHDLGDVLGVGWLVHGTGVVGVDGDVAVVHGAGLVVDLRHPADVAPHGPPAGVGVDADAAAARHPGRSAVLGHGG